MGGGDAPLGGARSGSFCQREPSKGAAGAGGRGRDSLETPSRVRLTSFPSDVCGHWAAPPGSNGREGPGAQGHGHSGSSPQPGAPAPFRRKSRFPGQPGPVGEILREEQRWAFLCSDKTAGPFL